MTVCGKGYRYAGFVERKGVRYLGQSVLFVTPARLAELEASLEAEGIETVVSEAVLGRIIRRATPARISTGPSGLLAQLRKTARSVPDSVP